MSELQSTHLSRLSLCLIDTWWWVFRCTPLARAAVQLVWRPRCCETPTPAASSWRAEPWCWPTAEWSASTSLIRLDSFLFFVLHPNVVHVAGLQPNFSLSLRWEKTTEWPFTKPWSSRPSPLPRYHPLKPSLYLQDHPCSGIIQEIHYVFHNKIQSSIMRKYLILNVHYTLTTVWGHWLISESRSNLLQ